MSFVYVALGSAAGGVVRWLLAGLVQRRLGAAPVPTAEISFPVGTLVVNVSGSLLVGLLAALAARQTGDGGTMRLLLMVGFCGGYTTMSTFSLDTVTLLEQGSAGLAALNLLATLALAFAATFAGLLVGRGLLARAGG